MTLFRRWLDRLLGLRSDVEDQLERSVRLNTAVAGAVAQAEAVKEAEQYAAELEKTHPQLAAALRGRIAEIVGGPPPLDPGTPLPAPATDGPFKKLTGRPKKPAELPAVPSNGGN